MDQDRVTRTTLPQVTVGIPLTLLKRVDEQAEAERLSRSKWIVNLIERELCGPGEDAAELTAVAS